MPKTIPFENKVSTHGQPIDAAGASTAQTIKELGGDPENPFVIWKDVQEAFDNRLEDLQKEADSGSKDLKHGKKPTRNSQRSWNIGKTTKLRFLTFLLSRKNKALPQEPVPARFWLGSRKIKKIWFAPRQTFPTATTRKTFWTKQAYSSPAISPEPFCKPALPSLLWAALCAALLCTANLPLSAQRSLCSAII